MDAERLRRLLQARHTCVRVVTSEEPEVIEVALDAASRMGLEPWLWSVTDGVRRVVVDTDQPVPNTTNPAAGLRWLSQGLTKPSLVILLDLAEHLSDATNLRAARDLLERVRGGLVGAGQTGVDGRRTRSAVVMIDHTDRVPGVIGGGSVRHEVLPPDDDEILEIVKSAIRSVARDGKIDLAVTRPEKDFLRDVVVNLRGLTRRAVKQLALEMVAVDRRLTDDDLETLQRGKRMLLEDAGVLEFVDAPTSLGEIGGLERLKAWLSRREGSFSPKAAEFGLTPPRGVLLLGVQGAGKSLAAKAIATAWRRPLMKLDPGSLFDKYIGETERKLRDALKQAAAMAPVVLWIDEIEKGFASAGDTGNDNGVSRRMFGTMLTWLQEHREPVFVVATANDINALPAELMRKGRFDEIFFVDLPTPRVRRTIFEIHLRKRKQDVSKFDLEAMSAESEGFSGAEIEQAVLSALHAAFSRGGELTTGDVVEALRASPPLSVTRREAIAALRAWAVGRCVPADDPA